METHTNQIELLAERIEAYAKTTLALSKLKSVQMTTVVVATLVARLSVIAMASLFILVLNIGIALLLGEVLGRAYWGFFIVAGFYLVAGIVLHFFLHTWIKKPITDLIIVQALS